MRKFKTLYVNHKLIYENEVLISCIAYYNLVNAVHFTIIIKDSCTNISP